MISCDNKQIMGFTDIQKSASIDQIEPTFTFNNLHQDPSFELIQLILVKTEAAIQTPGGLSLDKYTLSAALKNRYQSKLVHFKNMQFDA